MSFYTNVSRRGNKILLREITNSGQHIDRKIESFEPTLYIPSKDGTWDGLYGEKLRPTKPGSMRDCKELFNLYDGSDYKVHGNADYVAQYISESYEGDIDYNLSMLRIGNIDIEVGSENGFPYPELANEEVWAITIYDSQDEMYYVWGLGQWSLGKTELDFIQDNNVSYIECTSERDLLVRFVRHMNISKYDILTGWHIEGFDVPYLVNRITKVLGDTAVKKLSPWGNVREKTLKGMFGKESITYLFEGTSIVDYLTLYKKFTYKNQESYTLDHISYVELKESKLDYSEAGSLHTLYKTNFQKAIDYNIKDVHLVKRIDDKMKLLDLITTVAYYAKVNFTDVFSPVKTWDTIIYNYLKSQGIAIPPKEHKEKNAKFAGAYVKPPKIGFSDWILSFDLNSLYPHLIMQYNLGSDTLVTNIPEELSGININPYYTSDGKKEVDPTLVAKTKDLSALQGTNFSMAANGTFYRKDKRGFLPVLMDQLYIDRKKNKKIMLEWEQKQANGDNSSECINNISKYNNIQMAMKILLNSAYGAVGNVHFRYFDLRIAEAVTLSGQLSIKWIADKLNEFLNKSLGTDKDYVIAIDTDSNYIELGDMVKKVLPENTPDETIINILDTFCSDVMEPYIKKSYEELAVYMNAYENKMVMEREVIANRGFWTAKKRYVLNVWDSEGVRYKEPKLKVMGLESKKSSTPEICRDKLKTMYGMMINSDEADIQKYIEEFRLEWKTLTADQISTPSSCNGVTKYSSKKDIFVKGTPWHVKGALTHNHLVRKFDLENEIKLIQDGEKVKVVLMKKPNPTTSNYISFSGHLPTQIGLDSFIDYKGQFAKAFLAPANGALEAVGWNAEDQGNLSGFFV